MRAYRYTGGKITKPGAYVHVHIDAYHSGNLCEGVSISSTGLRRVLESPAHYFAFSPLNPDRIEDATDTRALRLGKAAHCAALEPEKFDAQFAISSYPDFKTAAAREERDKLENAGVIVLKQSEHDEIQAMAKAIRRDETAVSLFRDGLPEMTFAAKDEATGIWLLSRPDFVPAHPERGLVDYKTAANAEPEAWSRHAYSLGYHVQAGLACHVVEAVTGEKRDCFWFCVQEKSAPYVVQAARLDQDQIEFGKRQVRLALDRLAKCIETGQWPAYGGAAYDIDPPYHVRKLMEMAA